MNNDKLAFNAKQLDNELGISERHIHRLHSTGKLPEPIKIGRCVRWVVDEIRQWSKVGAPDRQAWERIKEANN